MATAAGLKWSAQLVASQSPASIRLPGDKIVLPPSALEQLLAASASAAAASVDGPSAPAWDPWNPRAYQAHQRDIEERQQQLPQPLTFRLVNPGNGRIIYAGIREFSADDGSIVISPFLQQALGIADGAKQQSGEEADERQDSVPQVTVHFQQLQRGTYVKLRPLEAGYDVEDWKALLEQYMRANFTTLTRGEVLEIPGDVSVGQTSQKFRFLIDSFKPDEEAVCVVDTDLEVDIEALNEEQARETVKQIAAKYQSGHGHSNGTSSGGDLDIFKERTGTVIPGTYVDYQLASWPRDQPIEIEVTPKSDHDDVDLLISPLSARQRSRPRLDDYVFADWEDRPSKRIRLQPTNVELEGAEALYVSVYAYPGLGATEDEQASQPRSFTIRVASGYQTDRVGTEGPAQSTNAVPSNPGDVRCKNCGQWVPGQTLMLHENFCLRNNVLCPQGCGQVFQKRSEAFERHWHCPHDTFFGGSALSRSKHDALYHPAEPLRCTRCATTQSFTSLPLLAQHHVTTCPAKIILCRFCHLAVPQEGDPDEPNPEALLSGLTPHELADGSRTTECHLCGRITRMRDMTTHLKHHDLERKSRPRPRVCRNANCGNTLDGASHNGSTRAAHKDPGNDIGLCAACFSPLYVTLHDPEGKALKRRIERRYLAQLMTGCGKPWCANHFCRTGRANAGLPEDGTSAKTALPLAKPFVDAAVGPPTTAVGPPPPLHFCVDEACQRRRERASLLEAELGRTGQSGAAYGFAWCVAALEAEGGDLDKARTWLGNYAPRLDEERM